jgi:hypothetical protein
MSIRPLAWPTRRLAGLRIKRTLWPVFCSSLVTITNGGELNSVCLLSNQHVASKVKPRPKGQDRVLPIPIIGISDPLVSDHDEIVYIPRAWSL